MIRRFDCAPRHVDANDAILDESYARRRGQRSQVDLRLAKNVLAGQHPRHHSRIRRQRKRRDERRFDAWLRRRSERTQDVQMRMAAADQNELRPPHPVTGIRAVIGNSDRDPQPLALDPTKSPP